LDPGNHGKKLGKWTPEEDAKLVNAVKKHGNDWVAIAAMVPGRTNQRCRERWVGTLDPATGKNLGTWSTEEDAKLKKAVKKHGNDWVAVAKLVPGRSNTQCRKRWLYTDSGSCQW
jgi:myb proto-oncogene protein